MHAEYDRRRRLMTDRFNAIGLACFEPKGAFYCFPHVTDATGLDETALRRGAARRGAGGRGARHGVRAVGRRPRAGLLRDRLRADRGGDGPHRALRRTPRGAFTLGEGSPGSPLASPADLFSETFVAARAGNLVARRPRVIHQRHLGPIARQTTTSRSRAIAVWSMAPSTISNSCPPAWSSREDVRYRSPKRSNAVPSGGLTSSVAPG